MSLAVERVGSGPDLVLLHGWGLHRAVWRPLVQPLSQHYRLHLVDLPGHGQSRQAEDSNQDWIGLLYDATPEQASWLGWSLGGLLTLQMAHQHVSKISRAIVVASSPRFLQAPDWPHAMTAETLQQFIDDLANDFVATVQRFLLLQIGGEAQSRQTIREMQQIVAAGPSPDPLALAQGLLLLRQCDLRPLLADIHQPVLVVQGGRDRLVPPEAATYLAAEIPSAQLSLFRDAGHAPFLSHTGEFLQRVEDFIHA